MSVSQSHHRTASAVPPQERRVAVDWINRQLRFERLLEEVRTDHPAA